MENNQNTQISVTSIHRFVLVEKVLYALFSVALVFLFLKGYFGFATSSNLLLIALIVFLITIIFVKAKIAGMRKIDPVAYQESKNSKNVKTFSRIAIIFMVIFILMSILLAIGLSGG